LKSKYYFIILFLILAMFSTGCSEIIPPTGIPSESEKFIGEWEAISPTKLLKVEISSFGNYLYIHVWHRGSLDHPESYDWGIQNYKISDSFNGVIKLHWDYFSNASDDQEIKVLNNGVLKIKSTRTDRDKDVSYSYTDYFYNPKAGNSFIPDISGVGLYQEDPEFVNLVYQLDSPQKICQYIEKNADYKILYGPHSPYQSYLSKEGDCGDAAVFTNCIAHFHGYESNYVYIEWTNGNAHAIVVYDMGDYYTYSSVYLYFSQSFNSIEACVSHCTSTYVGYILSEYEVFDWNYYNYRNITVR